jgi:DNA-directed RNA polymerase subunit RPC12/RpoP
MTDNPEITLTDSDVYQCPHCGAALKYKPGTDFLHCDYCGANVPINGKTADVVQELDFDLYAGQAEELDTKATKVIGCRSCGAESTFDESMKSVECPYCGTPLIESDAHEERLIQPSYLLPFKVSESEIHNHMSNWLSKRWFAPNKLKSRALHDNRQQGVYIPCWTYDARTETDYTGERGDNYTVTVGVGKNRRTETRTRWTYASGHISLFFDDVMIPASKIITTRVMDEISNWDMMNMVEADNRFLSGFITEKYNINMQAGYNAAKSRMKDEIDYAVRRGIGGDKQRIDSVKTRFSDIKFKLILLPVYMSSYTYNNKLYHFFVNGRTGNVTGDRPYSTVKITLAVIAGLILLALFIWFANTYGQSV